MKSRWRYGFNLSRCSPTTSSWSSSFYLAFLFPLLASICTLQRNQIGCFRLVYWYRRDKINNSQNQKISKNLIMASKIFSGQMIQFCKRRSRKWLIAPANFTVKVKLYEFLCFCFILMKCE